MRDTLLTDSMMRQMHRRLALASAAETTSGATVSNGRQISERRCIEAMRCELQDAGFGRDGEAIASARRQDWGCRRG